MILWLLACSQPRPDARAEFEHLIDQQASADEVAAYGRFLDGRAQVPGPWIQEIRVARSTDGLTFTEVPQLAVVSPAGVPEAVVGDDGRVYLFVVDGDLPRARRLAAQGSAWFASHGIPGQGALGLFVSSDGEHFEAVPDFGIDGAVRGMMVDPDVRRAPDGTWRMVYVGLPVPEMVDLGAWRDGAQHRVFQAESQDLVHWHQTGELVVGPYADPTVRCEPGGDCLMWSFGLDLSRSTDGGRSFAYQGSWGVPGFAPDVVPLPDGRLRLFYNDAERGAAIRSRVSEDDGATWQDEPGARLTDFYGEAPSVVQLPGGDWLMFYHRFQPGQEKRFEGERLRR